MSLRFSWFAAVVLALSTAACSPAADAAPQSLRATPATVSDVLAKAGDGDTVVLAPGLYAGVVMNNRTFQTPLVLEARGATLEGFRAKNVSGLTIKGGEFRVPAPVTKPSTGQLVYGGATRFDNVSRLTMTDGLFTGPGAPPGASGPFGEGYGVFVVTGSDITVTGGKFQGLKNGIVLSRVEGFKLTGNSFAANRSDGINVGEGRKGVIEKNECLATRIRDKEHPDCIQLWSRPTSPPVSDVIIRGNRAEGEMQGIGMFNHTRNGVNDGGFDRITIEDNDMRVTYPHGIALVEGRDSVVRNNRVSTLPGARWRARISVGTAQRCGNTIGAHAGRGSEKDPACRD